MVAERIANALMFEPPHGYTESISYKLGVIAAVL